MEGVKLHTWSVSNRSAAFCLQILGAISDNNNSRQIQVPHNRNMTSDNVQPNFKLKTAGAKLILSTKLKGRNLIRRKDGQFY